MKKPAVLLLFCALLSASNARAEEKSVVLWAQGDVRSQAPGDAEASPVELGAAIPQGSRIETGPDGSVGLGFEGAFVDSALMMPPVSAARLTELGESPRVDVEEGSVFTKLARVRKGSQFKVATPTAVATARGTGWKQSQDQIEVFEGAVDLQPAAGASVSVAAGEAYTLNVDGTLGVKSAAAEPGRQAWGDYTDQSTKSPYFGRIRVKDIIDLRQLIDDKRRSAACGTKGAFSWATELSEGMVVEVAPVNELTTALAQPPFKQTPGYTASFIDPIGEFKAGEPVRSQDLDRIRLAAENASC